MYYYLKALKKYATFSGRSTRGEFWIFSLINLFFLILAIFFDNLFGITLGDLGYGIIYSIYSLVILIPSLAVLVRRLHDIGKMGG